MGWLWSSSTPSKPINPTPPHDSPPIPPLEQSQPPPFSEHTPAPSDAPPPPQPSQNDLSGADLHALLTSLNPQSQSQSPQEQQPKFRTALPTSSPNPSSTPTPTALTPTHLHPKSLSCRSAFDTAFYCQSLGGQFNALYRYGGLRDCSALWSEFWVCLRINRARISEEERGRRVVEYFVRREGLRYGRRGEGEGRSSEDVWEQRGVLVDGEGDGNGEGRFEGDLEGWERDVAKRREEEKGEGDRERVGNGRGAMRSLYGNY